MGHAIVLKCPGARARLELNGVAVGGVEGDEPATLHVEEWLLPERNRLRIVIERGEGEQLALRVRPPSPTQPDALNVQWQRAEGSNAGPIDVVLPFPPVVAPTTRLAQDAVVLDEPLDERTRADAAWAALALYAAYARQSVDEVLDVSGWALMELAAAYPDCDVVGEARAEASSIVSRVPFALEPVEPEMLGFRRCLGGRVLEVTRSGRPLVETAPQKYYEPASKRVFVALAGGEWKVVR